MVDWKPELTPALFLCKMQLSSPNQEVSDWMMYCAETHQNSHLSILNLRFEGDKGLTFASATCCRSSCWTSES